MAKILDFQIIDHGVDHAQYFPGCGVAFTPYTDCVTGIGDSAREACEDALEQVAMSGDDNVDFAPGALFHAMDQAAASLSDVEDAHADCEHAKAGDGNVDPEDCGRDPEPCEMHHYVSVRWRVTESEG